jgi:hypothetical protein
VYISRVHPDFEQQLRQAFARYHRHPVGMSIGLIRGRQRIRQRQSRVPSVYASAGEMPRR